MDIIAANKLTTANKKKKGTTAAIPFNYLFYSTHATPPSPLERAGERSILSIPSAHCYNVPFAGA